MNDYFGAHMSIAGGIHLAPGRGVKVGCAVIQVFTQNSNQWRGKPVSDSDALLFREKWCESGLHEVVSHDIYLVNLASAPGETREKSLDAFREEMERCSRLGITKIIMHPGAHLGDGEETGIRRICEAFNQLFEQVPEYSGKVLLEATAGQGSNVGYCFEHLRAIIDGPPIRTASRSATTPAIHSPPATTSPPRTDTKGPSPNSTGSSAWTASSASISTTRKRD